MSVRNPLPIRRGAEAAAPTPATDGLGGAGERSAGLPRAFKIRPRARRATAPWPPWRASRVVGQRGVRGS